MQLTWNEVLARTDIIGGEIESNEDGIVYRGPLAEIKEDGEVIRFTSPWCARLDPDNGNWEKWDITSSFVNKDMVKPNDIGDGRIFFQMPFLGTCTIFPKGGSKLDRYKVKDLPKDWERLMALYPDLQFDHSVALTVCRDRAFPHQEEALQSLAPTATLHDFLGTFRAESSKEEFLWFYIEAVTEDREVHNKVY